MIKLIREGAMANAWVYRSIMIVIAVTFVVGMGWWGYGQTEADPREAVIVVGSEMVSSLEYRRAYQNAYRNYRRVAQGDVKDETIRQLVINTLIEDRLWLQAAKAFGLTATPDELRKVMTSSQIFHRNGKFDPDLYHRVIRSQNMTPAQFEAAQMEEILRRKAQALVRDSVILTAQEAEAIKQIKLPPPSASEGTPQQNTPTPEQLIRAALFQKQQRATLAFQESLKADADITIRYEQL